MPLILSGWQTRKALCLVVVRVPTSAGTAAVAQGFPNRYHQLGNYPESFSDDHMNIFQPPFSHEQHIFLDMSSL
jgi:hypothetical protein